MIRFFEWDYTRNVVTEYHREGTCNRCGACCRATIPFVSQREPHGGPSSTGGKGAWLEADDGGKGVWLEADDGGVHYLFKIRFIERGNSRCNALQEDHKCAVHDSKFPICRYWPLSPSCLEAFPECTYLFTEIHYRPIEAVSL
jgi:Fe-S-cluster containining protein